MSDVNLFNAIHQSLRIQIKNEAVKAVHKVVDEATEEIVKEIADGLTRNISAKLDQMVGGDYINPDIALKFVYNGKDDD